MRLDEFMRLRKLTQAALGSMLNPPVSQSQVSQWFRGRTGITLDQALQIQVLSDGEVTPADCAMVGSTDSSEPTSPAAA
ncbi:helix-turn-helix domain-containing protein [Burkholderia gladioli]|uniref:helix-turn-helix domain-containing protein n=1 Tax=Burkholderia gladioli TaxID=28095 RepID=UPI00163E3CAA|nr:helix-turn-helix transcriptional regulator [Burkholderia gladioli]